MEGEAAAAVNPDDQNKGTTDSTKEQQNVATDPEPIPEKDIIQEMNPLPKEEEKPSPNEEHFRSQTSSKEPSSEPQFKDAEKGADDEGQSLDENLEQVEGNDSEYEDVDEEDEEEGEEIDENNSSVVVETDSNVNDDIESSVDVQKLQINDEQNEQEHSEQKTPEKISKPKQKGAEKVQTKAEGTNEDRDLDEDANSPAYVPKKGRFYEHDIRTNDDSEEKKQETPRSKGRPYRDSDDKWQHDLFFDDADNARPHQTQNFRGSYGRRGGRGRSNRSTHDQLNIDDYMPSSGRGASASSHPRGHFDNETDEGHDPRRRPLPNNRARGARSNNFDVEDYSRPTSGNRARGGPGTPRRGKNSQENFYNESRLNQGAPSSDQTVHRERNFTNTNFQQQRNTPKTPQRDGQNQQGDFTMFNENATDVFDRNNNRGGKQRNQRTERPNEPPMRREPINNNRNQSGPGPALSPDAPNFERPKRFSNMRTNKPNPTSQSQPQQHQQQQHQQQPQQQPHQQQQQHPQQQQQHQHQQHQQQQHHQQQQQQQPIPIPIQTYPDQRSNFYETTQWRQLPSNPQTFMSQQNQNVMHPQMFHQQQAMAPPQPYFSQQYSSGPQYQQMNYAQGPMGRQMQNNK